VLDPVERDNLSHWTEGTQQSRCLPPLNRKRKRIQFPKLCVFWLVRILDGGQSPEIQSFRVLYTIIRILYIHSSTFFHSNLMVHKSINTPLALTLSLNNLTLGSVMRKFVFFFSSAIEFHIGRNVTYSTLTLNEYCLPERGEGMHSVLHWLH
jgi:hypothetical protein